jgi:mono/diheme cytochrome c family protein
MKWLGALLFWIVLTVGIGLIIVYSGVWNVAADRPHYFPVGWLADTTMEHSVRAHADHPQHPSLSDPQLIDTGAHHYREMCEGCHGAPGVERAEVGKGLNPEPPDLAKTVPQWSAEELFWIVKHGIRMTGMPAWGATHTDDKLWAIVAFLKTLPAMSAAEYQAMTKSR